MSNRNIVGGSGDFKRRIPVPSSRKFTPTPVKKAVMQKLFKDEMQNSTNKSKKTQKAKSVAEITPTKTPRSNRQKYTTNATIGLHATPRPLIFEETPSRRTRTCNSNEELKLKASWLIYRRILLYTWRRTRERLIMLHESFRRRQELVNQLELQVDVLKTLRKSETEKCENFIKEMNSLKIKFDFLLNDHKSLSETNLNLKGQIDLNQQRYLIETENQKNEILMKNIKIQQLESDYEQNLELLSASNKREMLLSDKLKTQHSIIKSQRETFKRLQNQLENVETKNNQLIEEHHNYRLKYQELFSKYEMLTIDYGMLEDHMNDVIDQNKLLEMNLEEYKNPKIWIYIKDFFGLFIRKRIYSILLTIPRF